MNYSIDYSNPASLLVKLKPNDTETIYYCHRPLTLNFATLNGVIEAAGIEDVIPLDISTKTLINFLKCTDDPFAIEGYTTEEQIETLRAIDYLGIGLDSGPLNLITDLVCQSYMEKGLEWKDFSEKAKEMKLSLYNPLDLIKVLEQFSNEKKI